MSESSEPDQPAAPTTILVEGRRTTWTVARFRLTVTRGPDQGAVLVSAGERVVVGTHESAELVLTDPTVSRLHVALIAEGANLIVRDLGSKNGTFIDGIRLGEAFVDRPVTLTIGKSEISLGLEDSAAELPLSERERLGVMVGRSEAIRRVFALVEKAAACDATVLIEGETGTGKEATAESIHRESARAEKPFLILDCGAIPRELLESELFGHERGAFTGAVAPRAGIFEAAAGGSILLDEIGELALDLQPKLLRVLERREVRRVGSNRTIAVDVRVMAATNRDLATEVNARRFRADLYYRLAVLGIQLPPLRERRSDLPLLVDHLLELLGARDTGWLRDPAFLAELAEHSWPGNVRELRNYLERSAALHVTEPLPSTAGTAGDPVVDLGQPLREAREAWTAVFERRYCEEMLRRHGGNVSASARASGMDRLSFYRLLWRLGLRERA